MSVREISVFDRGYRSLERGEKERDREEEGGGRDRERESQKLQSAQRKTDISRELGSTHYSIVGKNRKEDKNPQTLTKAALSANFSWGNSA